MATKRAQAGLANAAKTTYGDDELVCAEIILQFLLIVLYFF